MSLLPFTNVRLLAVLVGSLPLGGSNGEDRKLVTAKSPIGEDVDAEKGRSHVSHYLLEVVDHVVRMLAADRESNEIRGRGVSVW